MKLHGLSLIAGTTASAGGSSFRAINPASQEKLEPDFHEASDKEMDRALTSAAEAFVKFRACSSELRARFLETIADEIEKLGDTLLERANQETGLPMPRLQGERARTCGQLRLFASVVKEGSWTDARIDLPLPDRQPAPRPDLRRCLVPLGPVVVFGSSNFPFAFSVAGGDTASAFAAGCCVVVKAHRAHPGTAEMVGSAVGRAIVACGLPPGIFSLIHGGGATIGIAMVRHPATTAVGFTGSHTAGRALFDAAASRHNPIPVFAEMSSLNPVFLLPGALAERGEKIAQGLLASVTLGVGQFCTKPGLIFMLKGADTDAFLDSLSKAVQSAPCGTMLTPGIRDAFAANQKLITSASEVRVLSTAQCSPDPVKTQGQPSVAVTTARNFIKTPVLATEAFGPFTLAVIADSPEELRECVAALEGHLTATVHCTASDLESVETLLPQLEQKAGRLLMNSFPTGVEVSPAMNHGGPYPATTDVRYTSVGTAAMLRFARPVCYQDIPDRLLPPALQNANPLGLLRLVNGKHSSDPI